MISMSEPLTILPPIHYLITMKKDERQPEAAISAQQQKQQLEQHLSSNSNEPNFDDIEPEPFQIHSPPQSSNANDSPKTTAQDPLSASARRASGTSDGRLAATTTLNDPAQAKDNSDKPTTPSVNQEPHQLEEAINKDKGKVSEEATTTSSSSIKKDEPKDNQDSTAVPAVPTQNNNDITRLMESFRSKNFAEKLHALLSAPAYQTILRWNYPNGESFTILNTTAFVDTIMATHFAKAKFDSFTRRMRRWGFRRIESMDDKMKGFVIYKCKLFVSEKPELCKMMCDDRQRKNGERSSTTTAAAAVNNRGSPRPYGRMDSTSSSNSGSNTKRPVQEPIAVHFPCNVHDHNSVDGRMSWNHHTNMMDHNPSHLHAGMSPYPPQDLDLDLLGKPPPMPPGASMDHPPSQSSMNQLVGYGGYSYPLASTQGMRNTMQMPLSSSEYDMMAAAQNNSMMPHIMQSASMDHPMMMGHHQGMSSSSYARHHQPQQDHTDDNRMYPHSPQHPHRPQPYGSHDPFIHHNSNMNMHVPGNFQGDQMPLQHQQQRQYPSTSATDTQERGSNPPDQSDAEREMNQRLEQMKRLQNINNPLF